MYRLKQYLVFGGLLWVVLNSGLLELLENDALVPVLVGVIVFLLIVAVGVTLYAHKKKKEDGKDLGDEKSPLL